MDFHSDDDDFRIERRAQLGKQRRLVWVLSLAGLLPFIACTLVLLILGIENSMQNQPSKFFEIIQSSFFRSLGAYVGAMLCCVTTMKEPN